MSIKVYVERPAGDDGADIYIVDRSNGRRYLAQPLGDLVFKEIQDGDRREPTLRLGGFMTGDLLRALAEALDKIDVKTEKDAKLAGTLEATRVHLQDLRMLLNLRKRDDGCGPDIQDPVGL